MRYWDVFHICKEGTVMKKIKGLPGAAGQALYRALVLKRKAVELVLSLIHI